MWLGRVDGKSRGTSSAIITWILCPLILPRHGKAGEIRPFSIYKAPVALTDYSSSIESSQTNRQDGRDALVLGFPRVATEELALAMNKGAPLYNATLVQTSHSFLHCSLASVLTHT
jgi:hypothetical protein